MQVLHHKVEPLGQRLAQGPARPVEEPSGQSFVQGGVARERRAQGRDLFGRVDQHGHVVRAEAHLHVARQGVEDRRFPSLENGGNHRRPDGGAAGDLDLVLDVALGQHLDEMMVLQGGAGGDDRLGDLEAVRARAVEVRAALQAGTL